jgi:excisionase family DNA binding protein
MARTPTARKPPAPIRRRRRSSTPADPPPDMNGRLAYTYDEVAEILKVSERMVRQLATDGQLSRFYVGPQTPRISRAALIDFMAKGGAR